MWLSAQLKQMFVVDFNERDNYYMWEFAHDLECLNNLLQIVAHNSY